MKQIFFFISFLASFTLMAQESQSKLSFEFGISGERYEYGEKGFGISNGLVYQLSPTFRISPTLQVAYGFYRYFQNQYQPSFVEARYVSFQLPLQYVGPAKFDFLSIGIGPTLTFRSRLENDSFKIYTNAGSTRIYKYDGGYMYNTLYAGMVCQLEAMILRRNRFSIRLFANCNAYFNPFKVDYYGGGIKTAINL
jgi:hypothetical protein